MIIYIFITKIGVLSSLACRLTLTVGDAVIMRVGAAAWDPRGIPTTSKDWSIGPIFWMICCSQKMLENFPKIAGVDDFLWPPVLLGAFLRRSREWGVRSFVAKGTAVWLQMDWSLYTWCFDIWSRYRVRTEPYVGNIWDNANGTPLPFEPVQAIKMGKSV